MERFKEAAKFTLATLFFLACAVGIGWLEGPGIWRDLGVRSAGYVEAEGARVVTAWCKPSQVVFSTCDVSVEVAGEAKLRSFDFLALGGLIGRYQAKVVHRVAQPQLLTTTMALEHLPRRVAALLGLEATFLGLLAFGIRIRLRERAEKRTAASRATSPVWPRPAAFASPREPAVSRRSGRSWG